jgi:hypothetical protein
LKEGIESWVVLIAMARNAPENVKKRRKRRRRRKKRSKLFLPIPFSSPLQKRSRGYRLSGLLQKAKFVVPFPFGRGLG